MVENYSGSLEGLYGLHGGRGAPAPAAMLDSPPWITALPIRSEPPPPPIVYHYHWAWPAGFFRHVYKTQAQTIIPNPSTLPGQGNGKLDLYH